MLVISAHVISCLIFYIVGDLKIENIKHDNIKIKIVLLRLETSLHEIP